MLAVMHYLWLKPRVRSALNPKANVITIDSVKAVDSILQSVRVTHGSKTSLVMYSLGMRGSW